MSNRSLFLIHIVILLVLWAIAWLTDGVGGGGDSLTHYFMSELSWEQPAFFFDQWGKPFFTLFSSPWAQFGFIGIKLFNTLCGVLASLVTCLLAKELKKDGYFLIPFIALVGPAFFSHLFSGLTEPFAALVAVTSVWLCVSGRVSIGLVLAGFLPFCRSEAQIFLPLFIVFALLNGHWKKIPLPFLAYLLYSLVGGFIVDDFLWAFRSPYDSKGSVYGDGNWFHYLDRLPIMIGIPMTLLLVLGLVDFFRRWYLRTLNWKQEPWLVHAPFVSLLSAHTLVWFLGIYGSAGLERTLITAFPFLWLICLDGLLLLRDLSKVKKWLKPLPYLVLLLQLVYTAFMIPSQDYIKRQLLLSPEDQMIKSEVGPYIQNLEKADLYVVSKPYLAYSQGLNFKNEEQCIGWSVYPALDQVKSNTLLLYDSHYVTGHYGITLEQLQRDERLNTIQTWQSPRGHVFAVLALKP